MSNPAAPTPSPKPLLPRQPDHFKASQDLERETPLTAAGTRMRHKDHANEWLAYSMVVLITILIGALGERIYDRKMGISRDFPPELQQVLEVKSSGGRPAANPITGEPRLADDPARERELLAKLRQDAADEESLRALAAYYYETLRADEAIALYQQLLELHPDDAALMTDLAAMQFVQGEVALSQGVLPKDMPDDKGAVAAVATLIEATTVDHEYAPAWMMLGWAYQQIGQRAQAIESFRHALEHTEDPTMRHGLEQQIAQMEQTAQAPPGAPGSNPQINPLTGGPILPHDHDKEQAMLERAGRNPDDPLPHLSLGHYYYDTFQVKLSVQHYELYLSKGGEQTPEVMTDYATVLSELDLQKSLQILDEVAHAHTDFMPAWNNLAYLRRKAGDEAGAIRAMQEAYHHAPESERVRIAETLTNWGGEIPE